MLIRSPLLSPPNGVSHAFFTREGGRSNGLYASLNGGLGSADEPVRIIENRALMARTLGVTPKRFLSLKQVHSQDVVVVEEPWDDGARPTADAMVSARPGIALAIATADCAPVLFVDTRAGVIGAAHAGWRGALAGVLDATIARMEGLGARRADIAAALGPTISQPNYEVGPELREAFLAGDASAARYFAPGEGDRLLFDLPGYIGARLAALGVGAFEDVRRCTYAEDERFFSYRRATHRAEPDYGRLISSIALTP
ncbi:MAG: peptidoglycan editing factor PgeF [Salinarimonadaceae bacterium]|nr:MAG: peptidoglycan editing factor PgeF [Salinarimonadaceae bacterium]